MNLKLVYLEEISSKNIDFLNKGYKVIKNAILKEKKEIESKYQQSSEKIVRLREKLSILEKGSKTSDDLLYKSLDLQVIIINLSILIVVILTKESNFYFLTRRILKNKSLI